MVVDGEFAEWMEEHAEEIREAQAFSVDDLPHEPAPLSEHLSLAQSLYPRMGVLLADAEGFVLRAHAAAVVETRRQYPDMSAEERKIMAKADRGYLDALRLRDSLKVCCSALKAKGFAVMNLRRTGMDAIMSS